MERDIKAVMADLNATIGALDKIKGNLEGALRKAQADLATLFGNETPSPNRSRKTPVMNGGNVMPTPGARTGPD